MIEMAAAGTAARGPVAVFDARAWADAEAALFDPVVRVLSITGRAGSGKSTLRRHLMQLAALSGPTVCVFPFADAARLEADAWGYLISPEACCTLPALVARPPCKFVFVEDGFVGASETVRIALSRSAAFRAGKVIVIGEVAPGFASRTVRLSWPAHA